MIEKALIYATTSRGLLVFDEPDFPEVPIQVPGGTVEGGEQVIDAARREFGEETGLLGRTGFRLLGDSHRPFERDGVHHDLHRTYLKRSGSKSEQRTARLAGAGCVDRISKNRRFKRPVKGSRDSK